MLECAEISGHVDVQCVLWCMYSFGEGVEKDHEKAFMYWKRAAMQVPTADYRLPTTGGTSVITVAYR